MMAEVMGESRDPPFATEVVFVSHNEEDTRKLGRELARLLPDPAVVALVGTLGSGKTRFVQGLAEGCGCDPRLVTSPTFVLIQEYLGRRRLYHFDVYRLKDVSEFVDLGTEEYFVRSGITAIEWADRVRGYLPTERVDVFFEIRDTDTRTVRVVACHPRYAECVESLRPLYS